MFLLEHCSNCCLPYFDSRLDSRLRDARQSTFWADDLMGSYVIVCSINQSMNQSINQKHAIAKIYEG